MILSPIGREYLELTTSDNEGGTLDVSFDEEATWSPLEVMSATEARALVAGPEATANPAGTVVVPLGVHRILVRLTLGNEVVVREAPELLEVG